MWCRIDEMEDINLAYGEFEVPFWLWYVLPIQHEFKREEYFHQIPTTKIWDKSLKAMVFARSYKIFGNRIN